MRLLSLLFRRARDPERVARRQAFDEIYSGKHWGEGESVSGAGSGIERTLLFRADLEGLLRELNVRTLLDAGCGDFKWLPTFNLHDIRIIAIDVVPDLILANQKRHPQTEFVVADFVSDGLPKSNLILCRDGLVHLSDADVVRALGNFRRSGAKWLLTNTFLDHKNSADIRTGEWRPLNLERPPFSLPPPSRLIDERCFGYEGAYRDKRLALWSSDDLPAAR